MWELLLANYVMWLFLMMHEFKKAEKFSILLEIKGALKTKLLPTDFKFCNELIFPPLELMNKLKGNILN